MTPTRVSRRELPLRRAQLHHPGRRAVVPAAPRRRALRPHAGAARRGPLPRARLPGLPWPPVAERRARDQLRSPLQRGEWDGAPTIALFF